MRGVRIVAGALMLAGTLMVGHASDWSIIACVGVALAGNGWALYQVSRAIAAQETEA